MQTEDRFDEAAALDGRIDDHLKRTANQLARAHLDLAALLKQMHDTQGYRFLAAQRFDSWGDYLDSKQAYGRTYLSYLMKLGRAGDLARYVDAGISGSMLIEVAKHTDYPERIPELLDEASIALTAVSVRHAARLFKELVTANPERYKRPRQSGRRGRPRLSLHQQLARQFEALPGRSERQTFLEQLKRFVHAYEEQQDP